MLRTTHRITRINYPAMLLVLILLISLLSTLHAQPKTPPATGDVFTFTHTLTTFDRSLKIPIPGSTSWPPPISQDSGMIYKRSMVTAGEMGRRGRMWGLAVGYDAIGYHRAHHLEWSRAYTTDSAGNIHRGVDSLYIPRLHTPPNMRFSLFDLSEYGGRSIELWRLIAPPRLWTAFAGEFWGDQFLDTLIDTASGLQQVALITRTYQYRGIIDTLGTKTMGLQWKVIVRSISAKRCHDCSNEHTLWGYATGMSYFSPNDGLLLFGVSDEEINLIAAGGLVNMYLDIVGEVRRDGMVAPGGEGITGEKP